MERLGFIRAVVDGNAIRAKGDYTYNLGHPKAEAVLGTLDVAGKKTTPQVPYIEGAITDSAALDLAAFLSIEGATVFLELANGKSVVLRDAFYAGDGEVSTAESEIKVRFEGSSCEEV